MNDEHGHRSGIGKRVAQVGNLLYRRLAVGWMSEASERPNPAPLPVTTGDTADYQSALLDAQTVT